MQKYNEKNSFYDDLNLILEKGNIFKIKDLKTDIIEEKDRYILEIDVPGISKEDINITYSDKYLTVFINKIKEENNNYIKRERMTSSITRRFYLSNINEEKIKAKLVNGVLNIICEKTPEITNKNIKIE